MSPLFGLTKQGQSIWLDYIRRSFLTSGDFKRLIEEDGVRGVTSNPTIFEKAIDGSSDYDDALRALLDETPSIDAGTLYDRLAIEDVRMAADLLRPAYDLTAVATGSLAWSLPRNRPKIRRKPLKKSAGYGKR